MRSGEDAVECDVEKRIEKILEHVKAGKLVTVVAGDHAYVARAGSRWASPCVLRASLATGAAHCTVRGGHVSVPLDGMALYNLLGSTFLLRDGSQVPCDGWAAASTSLPELVSVGGEAYTAQELFDRQVMWRPFGAGDPHPWLPCWNTVLEDGVVL